MKNLKKNFPKGYTSLVMGVDVEGYFEKQNRIYMVGKPFGSENCKEFQLFSGLEGKLNEKIKIDEIGYINDEEPIAQSSEDHELFIYCEYNKKDSRIFKTNIGIYCNSVGGRYTSMAIRMQGKEPVDLEVISI